MTKSEATLIHEQCTAALREIHDTIMRIKIRADNPVNLDKLAARLEIASDHIASINRSAIAEVTAA